VNFDPCALPCCTYPETGLALNLIAYRPFYPGRHCAEAGPADLPDRIAYFLTHDREREELVDEAFEGVVREWTMAGAIEEVLKLCGKINVDSSDENSWLE
jgi:spore maturation protein CgeB